MTPDWNRIASGTVAAIYVLMGVAAGGGFGGLVTFGFVVLPLACIWFGKEMGEYVGPAGSIWISMPSPGTMVCIAGWLLLLSPILWMVL